MSSSRSSWTPFARFQSLPHERGEIVPKAAEGTTNVELGKAMGDSRYRVGKRRERFVDDEIEGLSDEHCSGHPGSIDDEKVAELVSKPEGARQRSCRQMVRQTGASKSTV
jgi:hypothetical protein